MNELKDIVRAALREAVAELRGAPADMTALLEDDLYTMVNLRGRSTGLSMNIWIGPRGHARHAARIKVQMDHREQFDIGNLAVVSVEDDPPRMVEGRLPAADLALVQRYVALNRAAIIDHWNETTDGVELTRALKPLS
jgi:hypothetical protein